MTIGCDQAEVVLAGRALLEHELGGHDVLLPASGPCLAGTTITGFYQPLGYCLAADDRVGPPMLGGGASSPLLVSCGSSMGAGRARCGPRRRSVPYGPLR